MATQEDIEAHYDVDNDFFGLFLDKKHRVYTSGVWRFATNLEDAQTEKFDRIIKYAGIKPGDKVIDVGCGYGGLMSYITKTIPDTHVHGITISSNQYDFVKQQNWPNVTIDLISWKDYQPPTIKFDAIVTVCAFEHFATVEEQIANKQRDLYNRFFNWCLSISTTSAQIGMQSIVMNRLPQNIIELKDTKFLLEEVFPGSAMSCISDIQACTADKYEMSSAKRIGMDYVRTLVEWKKNLESAQSTIVERYGLEVYEHHFKYLDAARRCFESGYTDLYQVSLKRAKSVRVFTS